MLPDDTISLHPRKWPALIPFGIAVLVFGFLHPPVNDRNLTYVCLGLVALSLLLWWILTKSYIKAGQTGLTIGGVFARREMAWSGVSQSYIRYRHHGKSGSYYWYFVDKEGKKIRFSTRIYSRQSLHQLAEMLLMHSPAADIEDRVRRIAEGNFPWYIF
jgi:hypothetical protein